MGVGVRIAVWMFEYDDLAFCWTRGACDDFGNYRAGMELIC